MRPLTSLWTRIKGSPLIEGGRVCRAGLPKPPQGGQESKVFTLKRRQLINRTVWGPGSFQPGHGSCCFFSTLVEQPSNIHLNLLVHCSAASRCLLATKQSLLYVMLWPYTLIQLRNRLLQSFDYFHASITDWNRSWLTSDKAPSRT